MPEQFSNFARTVITGAIDADDTSLTVDQASNFPASGDFRVRCENEIMLVTARAGATFTVTRGYENTTAAGHAAGTGIAHVMTAAGFQVGVNEHQFTEFYLGGRSTAYMTHPMDDDSIPLTAGIVTVNLFEFS